MKMKKILISLFVVLFMAGTAWAGDEPPSKNACPKTTMQTNCLKCHVEGDFRVKETAPDAQFVYPNKNMKIMWKNGEAYGYYLLTDIAPESVLEFFRYLKDHWIRKAVIEIHSPGGGLFDAQKIVSIMEEWRATGGTIETRVYGMAFSAGFYIFVTGDKGKRFVYPYSDLMWHEVRTIEGWGLRLVTPATKEDEARVFRHLQDVRNTYLATRGKLSKEELDAKVKYKDWWMSGAQAVEYGFADGFIGK